MSKNNIEKSKLLNMILEKGIYGAGPFKSAQTVADEALRNASGDAEKAIERVIRNHSRTVGTSGFASGLGGLATIAVAVPADISVFYANAARMIAAIAIIRGYDTESEDVRTAVAVSLIGAFGSEALSKIGVDVARRGGAAALKKLPGRVLIEINKKVGFRLFTKMGTTGSINLVKAIPLISSGVGATLNFTSMKAIGGYAKSNFPRLMISTI